MYRSVVSCNHTGNLEHSSLDVALWTALMKDLWAWADATSMRQTLYRVGADRKNCITYFSTFIFHLIWMSYDLKRSKQLQYFTNFAGEKECNKVLISYTSGFYGSGMLGVSTYVGIEEYGKALPLFWCLYLFWFHIFCSFMNFCMVSLLVVVRTSIGTYHARQQSVLWYSFMLDTKRLFNKL